MIVRVSFCAEGSPPRVRGKAEHTLIAFAFLRITPARAGKSCCRNSLGCCRWDHPRACGEKLFQFFAKLFFQGSPPRVRGKVFA